MCRWAKFLFLFILSLLASSGRFAMAQDSHYWSHQYGGRALLLTGAVVGGIGDGSAAYYNPGGLALTTSDEVILGTQVFDLTNILIETETGEEAQLDSDDLGRAPSFLGGVLPFRLGKHRFAYAVFKRHAFDVRADGAAIGNFEAESFHEATVFARTTLDSKLSERWYGGSWAYPVSKTLGVGLSTFLARRQQYLEIEVDAEGLGSDGTTVIATETDYYKYWHYRMLWKAGIYLDLDQISFGATITTPGVKVYGNGERILNYAQSGAHEIGGEDEVSVDVQELVPVTYRSPISAALGISMYFDHRSVNVSVEAFDKIDQYEVLDLQPAFSQSTGELINNQIVTSSESVVNVAVGYEEFFSEKVTGFVSASTDYSAAPTEDVTNLALSRWDLYHLTGGTIFHVSQMQFILGAGYSFGSAVSTRIAAPEYSGLPQVISDPVPSEIHFRRFKLILGFSFTT